MCSYKFSVQAASCVLAVLALPLSVSVLTASAISLQFKNYPNAHVVHDVYPPRGDLAAKEVVEGPLAPATLVKALRRLAQDAPSPYDTDVSAIATSALIPYELLYGKVIPHRMPCPEGDPGVTGDNCGPEFNPCEDSPIAGPANTCRRLQGAYRCIPNTCTQSFKWRGVELPANPCMPIFLDSTWGTPALWCTDPAYTGGVPGAERARQEARQRAQPGGQVSSMQQSPTVITEGPSSLIAHKHSNQQPYQPPDPAMVIHGPMNFEHSGGLDYERPLTISPGEPESRGRFNRGLKQELPPEVLSKLAEMGLSRDDVEIVEYPPGTDREAALRDFYSRQGNEGADASAIQTSLIPGQSDGSEEQRSALERWLDEDWHELPAITLDVSLRVMEFAQRASQQLLNAASDLAPFLQDAARRFSSLNGAEYSSKMYDWTSNDISNSINISLPGPAKDSNDEGTQDGKEDDEDIRQGAEKKESSLKSIWDEHKSRLQEKGKTVAASTLCECSNDGKAAVCCAGARQYASKALQLGSFSRQCCAISQEGVLD